MRGGVKDPALAYCMVIDVCKGTPSFEYKIGGGGVPAGSEW